MKTSVSCILSFIALLLALNPVYAQVAINTDGIGPDGSAMLDIKSTSKGLLVPRMNTAQRNLITSPANGLMIFQTDGTPGYYYNAGSTSDPFWKFVGGLTLPYSGSVTQDAGYTFSLTSSGSTCIYSEGLNGVLGVTNSSAGFGAGVKGTSFQTTGEYNGVEGSSSSSEGIAVLGRAWSTSGDPKGVYGETRSPSGHGISGRAYSNGYSGYFLGGKVYISGNIGIGTLTPTCQLVVNAPDDASRNMIQVIGGTGNNRVMIRQNSNGAGSVNIYDPTNTVTTWLVGDGWNNYINVNDYNLGIGTTAPTQKLDVNGGFRVRSMTTGVLAGTVYRTSDGTLITGSSDIRLKENIQPLENSLGKVLQLKGVSFNWKAEPQRKSIGFIAQEFEKVIPELVFTNETDGYKGINYAEVTAVLTEAIKELNTKNNQLKAENDNLKARLEKLEALMNQRAEK